MSSRAARVAKRRLLQVAGFMAAMAGAAPLAAPLVQQVGAPKMIVSRAAELSPRPIAPTLVEELVWRGIDVDGDGQSDFANPTGQDVRTHDAYGKGEFGASRDGGTRRHEGVDFVAAPGQRLVAPISGFVTRIGFAYPGDAELKFVEITNPALRYAARVFYVDPQVEVGQAVRLGQAIGRQQTLARKYPGGMTEHVHLEIIDARGQRIDATQVINARYEPVPGPGRG